MLAIATYAGFISGGGRGGAFAALLLWIDFHLWQLHVPFTIIINVGLPLPWICIFPLLKFATMCLSPLDLEQTE